MGLIETWTTEQRYLPYDEWDKSYVNELQQVVNQSIWRTHYHIQAPTGLLNDPNGFSFFNGEWHLFYQFYPMGPVHGIKSWYHLSSTNLVDWTDNGVGLLPDNQFDSHGAYSGTAVPVGEELFLFYTGNVRNEEWERSAYQLGAIMDKQNKVTKLTKPLILPNDDYTDHFRDPQVFFYQDKYYLVLGAQDKKLRGKVVTYHSDDLMNWIFIGELKFTEKDMGFMIECPNLLFSNDQVIFIFCPQGISQDVVVYDNIFPNTYLLADEFNPEKNELINPTHLKNLDEGFDVYATQAFNAPDNRVLGVSWVGLPEIAYPSDKDGWAHVLSLVKEFKIEDGNLIQRPAEEVYELRQENKVFESNVVDGKQTLINEIEHCYELNLLFEAGSKGKITLLADNENQGFEINFDTKHGTMSVNRENIGEVFAKDYGTQRAFEIDKSDLQLQVFVDQSVIEIFINDGKQVVTSRVFPIHQKGSILVEGNFTVFEGNLWTLRSMK